MSARAGWLERAVLACNRSWLWKGRHTVWNQRMASATFERWLYLRLHRLGLMGKAERLILQKLVQPGMSVVDIGANLGLYTVLLSRLVGPKGAVIAFEPDPELCGLLQQSTEVNGCLNVRSHAIALGEKSAEITLQRGILNSGDNYLGAPEKQSFRRSLPIRVAALDEIEPGLCPDFIKLDVQGWELPVLRGMRQTLRRNPNVILLVEFWPDGCRRAGYEPGELIRFLHENDFVISAADQPSAVLTTTELIDLERRLRGMHHADLVVRRKSKQSNN